MEYAICFIQPNLNEEKMFPNLGIASIISYIRNNTCHNVHLVDLTFHPKEWKSYLLDKLNKLRPDVVALSLTSSEYFDAISIADFIKLNFSKMRVLFGGVHPTLRPNEVLADNKSVDLVCIGEGEQTVKEYLNNNLNPKEINGLAYKNKNKIIINPPRPLIQDLDSLPFPDWSDFEMENYFANNDFHLPIMASRGCPYLCTYCSNHALKKKLNGKYNRCRSVKSVINEINFQKKLYNFKFLFFYDDTLLLYKEFIVNFCKMYIKNNLHKQILFNINVRPNLVDEGIVRQLSNAGCFKVRIGIESGNPFIRNEVFKRNMTNRQIIRAIKILKKYCIQIRGNFIIGAPYDNLKTINDTYNMIKKVNLDQIHMPILWVLPETEIEKVLIKEGLTTKEILTKGPKSITRTKYITEAQLKKIYKKLQLYRYYSYFIESLKRRHVLFLYDLAIFFLYYKHKYNVGISNLTKFTLNKYQHEDAYKLRIN